MDSDITVFIARVLGAFAITMGLVGWAVAAAMQRHFMRDPIQSADTATEHKRSQPRSIR